MTAFVLVSLFCFGLVAVGALYRRGEMSFALCAYSVALFPVWADMQIAAPIGSVELTYPLYLCFFPLYSSVYLRRRQELLPFVWSACYGLLALVAAMNLLSGDSIKDFDWPAFLAFSTALFIFTGFMRIWPAVSITKLLTLSIIAALADLGVYWVADPEPDVNVYAGNVVAIVLLMPFIFLPLARIRR